MRKIRKKKCKICGKSFTPFKTTQKVCSPECAIQLVKEKKAKELSDLNEQRNIKDKVESLSELVKQTQIIVNKYIRLRDKGKTCIGCGQKLGVSYDAGHIHDVKQYNMIRFDENNIFGECIKCNRFEEGNYDLARLNAKKRIGNEEYQKLEKRSKIALRVPYTFTKHELKEIQKKFKQKIKEL